MNPCKPCVKKRATIEKLRAYIKECEKKQREEKRSNKFRFAQMCSDINHCRMVFEGVTRNLKKMGGVQHYQMYNRILRQLSRER